MRNRVNRFQSWVLLLASFGAAGSVLAAQEVGRPAKTQVALGQEMAVKGVIVERDADHFTLRDYRGLEFSVAVNEYTRIGEKKRNFLRAPKDYSPEHLLLGLHVLVKGIGDRSGLLQAREIKFTQDDLRVAKTISSRVSPVEERLDQAHARLDETEARLQDNVQGLSGQVTELNEAFRTVRDEAEVAYEKADQAQETADHALSLADATKERVGALDEYQEVRISIIRFSFDSAALSAEAKQELDGLVMQAADRAGFLIEVKGFASTDGNEVYNRRLSQRRAESVVRYLAESHDIPLRRILTPHGYGELNPVAENTTAAGRNQNRRVEVRLLVNRGLGEPADMISVQPHRN